MMTSDILADQIDASSCNDIDGVNDLGELLDVNWQTTAALGLGVATGGLATGIMLAAFPAQTIGAGASIGLLAYAGKRRADGKDAFPFMNKQEDIKSEKTEEKTEA